MRFQVLAPAVILVKVLTAGPIVPSVVVQASGVAQDVFMSQSCNQVITSPGGLADCVADVGYARVDFLHIGTNAPAQADYGAISAFLQVEASGLFAASASGSTSAAFYDQLTILGGSSGEQYLDFSYSVSQFFYEFGDSPCTESYELSFGNVTASGNSCPTRNTIASFAVAGQYSYNFGTPFTISGQLDTSASVSSSVNDAVSLGSTASVGLTIYHARVNWYDPIPVISVQSASGNVYPFTQVELPPLNTPEPSAIWLPVLLSLLALRFLHHRAQQGMRRR